MSIILLVSRNIFVVLLVLVELLLPYNTLSVEGLINAAQAMHLTRLDRNAHKHEENRCGKMHLYPRSCII
jgi:hypothetical protein